MIAAGWTVVRLRESDVKRADDLGQFVLTQVRAATGFERVDLLGPARRGSRR